MINSSEEPFVTIKITLQGPTIKHHAMSLVVGKREQATMKTLELCLARLSRACLKTLALAMKGINLEAIKRGEVSDDAIDAAMIEFGVYGDVDVKAFEKMKRAYAKQL